MSPRNYKGRVFFAKMPGPNRKPIHAESDELSVAKQCVDGLAVRDWSGRGQVVLFIEFGKLSGSRNTVFPEAAAVGPAECLHDQGNLFAGTGAMAIESLGQEARSFTGSQAGVITDAAHAWVHAYYNAITKRLKKLADRYGFMILSDECYSEIYTRQAPGSALECAGPDFSNVVAFQSLSKRSNLPGLRSGFCAGDGDFIETLAEDSRGRIWIETAIGAAVFEGGRFTPAPAAPPPPRLARWPPATRRSSSIPTPTSPRSASPSSWRWP